MTPHQAPHRKPFTGRHMAAVLVLAFSVIVGINIAMATLASSTFGGVVVENSYVASQNFNRWLDEAEKEKALGWQVAAARRDDGRIAATLTGVPRYADVVAEARHPLGRMPDVRLTFVRDASGAYISDRPLAPGRWTLRFQIESEGTKWRGEQPVS